MHSIGSPLLELGRAGFYQYARGSFQWEWFCYAEVAAQEFNLRTPARHVNLNKRWLKLTRVLDGSALATLSGVRPCEIRLSEDFR